MNFSKSIQSLSWINNKLLLYISMVDPNFVVRFGGRSKTISIQVAYRTDLLLTITEEFEIKNHRYLQTGDDLESIQRMLSYARELVNYQRDSHYEATGDPTYRGREEQYV